MANFADLSRYAQLSEAAYADLSAGKPIPKELQLGGMALEEANGFAAEYLVIDRYSDGTGVSATIFQDLAGKRYLAIRGTDDPIDAAADFILANGYPAALNAQYVALRSQIDAWTASGDLSYKFTVTVHAS